MRSTSLRRVGSIAGLSVALVAGITASTPFRPATVKAVTYRLRMSSQLPPMMAAFGGDAGGAGGGPMILAKFTAIGNRARAEIQAFQPMPPGMSIDDYILIDSARTLFVDPDNHTYTDAGGLLGGGGLGMLSAMANGRGRGNGGGGGGGNMSQVDMTNIVTDIEDVGPDTVDGRQAQHYRMVVEANVAAMGQQMPMRIVTDVWTATLAYKILNPFDVSAGAATPSADDPGAKLTAKILEMRKQMQGTPIKTTTTTSITIAAMGGSLDFVQTTAITDIKEVDVDPKLLDLPAGYTKKGSGY